MTPSLVRIWIACLVLVASAVRSAEVGDEQQLRLQLPSGQELVIQGFAGSGESKVLWLPSERGLGAAHKVHATALAKLGHETWLADLHDAYFIERNRRSIARFPLEDIVALIDAAASDAESGLVLVSSSRGAQLALIAAREWQLRNPGKTSIKGLVLVHAHLYESRPDVGAEAVYLPISEATNLPVYLLEAQYSTKSARIRELVDTLTGGGSQVFTELLSGVQGGFFARDDEELSMTDLRAKKNYATTLNRAIQALELVSTPKSANASQFDTRRFSHDKPRVSGLISLDDKMPAPRLQLKDINQQDYRLGNSTGRVILVNFWATWCRPCVAEIPSLHRLRAALDSPEFEIVTVNVGEGRDRLAPFLKRTPVKLPLLMDSEGKASKDWKVYVYPSSYLVDHQGKIRYAYLGALVLFQGDIDGFSES
ncbi:MAG: TlpA family protein disulfide reductase [Gammaproteobacteria bacterium]|nr:TlpA family protein disulfide reductase [Gammaproteobacteria bacterium]